MKAHNKIPFDTIWNKRHEMWQSSSYNIDVRMWIFGHSDPGMIFLKSNFFFVSTYSTLFGVSFHDCLSYWNFKQCDRRQEYKYRILVE
jgi:hypothetical protein